MTSDFFQRRRDKKALRAWQKSTIGKVLTIHTDEYFVKNPRLASFDEENKNKVVADFYQEVLNLSDTDNPFLAMRESLAGYALGYTEYQVLCLTEVEKAESFYSDCPYISGELHKDISTVTEHNDELGKLKWKDPDISDEELISFCNTRSVLHLYYLNGINHVRIQCDDSDKEKDWLLPFVKSMLIWKEDQVRGKIGRPSLLHNSLDALRHSTFMNLVMSGHKNPLYEWEKGLNDWGD